MGSSFHLCPPVCVHNSALAPRGPISNVGLWFTSLPCHGPISCLRTASKLPASSELGGDKVSRPARGLLFPALGAMFRSLTYLQSYSDSHSTLVRSLHLLRTVAWLDKQTRESFLLPMTSAQPSCTQCLHIPSVTLGVSYYGAFIRF